jgi:sugar phosphate permease
MDEPQQLPVESMKDTHQVLVSASVTFTISIVFFWLSRSNIASADNPFLSAQTFFAMGFLFFGFSLGLLASIGYIVRIEKKRPQTPQPP